MVYVEVVVGVFVWVFLGSSCPFVKVVSGVVVVGSVVVFVVVGVVVPLTWTRLNTAFVDVLATIGEIVVGLGSIVVKMAKWFELVVVWRFSLVWLGVGLVLVIVIGFNLCYGLESLCVMFIGFAISGVVLVVVSLLMVQFTSNIV